MNALVGFFRLVSLSYLFFVGLSCVYVALPWSQAIDDALCEGTARAAQTVCGLISDGVVGRHGTVLASRNYISAIAPECTGLDLFGGGVAISLLAAGSWTRRALHALVLMAIVGVVNQVRIVSLMILGQSDYERARLWECHIWPWIGWALLAAWVLFCGYLDFKQRSWLRAARTA
jgi:exosortase/archaeosortase family protein